MTMKDLQENAIPKKLDQYSASELDRLRTLFTLNDRYGQLSMATCFLLSLFEIQPLAEREAMRLVGGDYEAFRKQFQKLRKAGFLDPTSNTYKDTSTGRNIPRLQLGECGKALFGEIRNSVQHTPVTSLDTRVELYLTARETFPTLYMASLPSVLAVQQPGDRAINWT